MTNGNDVVEHEEENSERLEEEFINGFNQRAMREWIIENEEIMTKFKETFSSLWEEHLEEDHSTYQANYNPFKDSELSRVVEERSMTK